MKARITLLVIFIAVMGAITKLSGFQEQFDAERPMDRALVDTIAQEKELLAKKQQEEMEKQQQMQEAGEGVVKLDTPELKRGHEIYHGDGACYTCHGEKAEGNKDFNAPLLAGQFDWYLYDQLVLMKNNERVNEDMQPFVEMLDEEDFKAVSAYISKMRL